MVWYLLSGTDRTDSNLIIRLLFCPQVVDGLCAYFHATLAASPQQLSDSGGDKTFSDLSSCLMNLQRLTDLSKGESERVAAVRMAFIAQMAESTNFNRLLAAAKEMNRLVKAMKTKVRRGARGSLAMAFAFVCCWRRRGSPRMLFHVVRPPVAPTACWLLLGIWTGHASINRKEQNKQCVLHRFFPCRPKKKRAKVPAGRTATHQS